MKNASGVLKTRNKRSNRYLTLDGETLPLATWAERYHMNAETVAWRINRGWSLKDALETPPGVRKGTTLLHVKEWQMFEEHQKPNVWHHVPD